jgi:type II secretory pathway predicted ATPase ExeA
MDQDSSCSFAESPFQDGLDQKFFFPTKEIETLLAELGGFIETHQGLASVRGDAGMGKTMLVAALVQRLPPSIHPIVITRPGTKPMGLIVNIASAMDLHILKENLVDLTSLADANGRCVFRPEKRRIEREKFTEYF